MWEDSETLDLQACKDLVLSDLHSSTEKLSAESEKPRRRVGIADRKVFARPESFMRVFTKLPIKCDLNIN